MTKLITSTDPQLHALNIKNSLTELIDHLEFDVNLVNDARFQALAESHREILKAMRKTYDDYRVGTEKAWRKPQE